MKGVVMPKTYVAHKIKNKKKLFCEKCEVLKQISLPAKKKLNWYEAISLYRRRRFEDDPRALKENDVGRVRRNPTHVNPSSAIDDIG